MKICNSLIFIALLMLETSAQSHEVETHEKISAKAVGLSNMSSHLAELGIGGLSDNVLPNRTAKSSHSFNSLQCTEQKLKTMVSVVDMVLLGAWCEDVTFGDSKIGFDGLRFLKHFYDPTHGGRGFFFGSFPSSQVWALEEPTFYGQKFSYTDARAYYFNALTLPAKNDRDDNSANTFRSIGHVIHLIQDLTQPQHTRDDPHGSGSLFEQYTNQEEVREKLPMSGYAPVAVTKLHDIWDTGDLKGLANFSNMNFVTKGTNFDRWDLYASPRVDTAKVKVLDIVDLCVNRVPACPNSHLKGKIKFYGNDVNDRYTGEVARDDWASSEGFFDEELIKANYVPGYTLNRFNFESSHTFLIPRAAGYSAGLINYFFRGNMDFVQDSEVPWRYSIKNLSNEDMDGKFELYYDDKDGKRHKTPNKWNTQIRAHESYLVSIAPNADDAPDPAVPGQYILVFNGNMGNEKTSLGSSEISAVAAKKFDDPIRLKLTRANYWAMGLGSSDPISGLDTEFEFDQRLVDLLRAGSNKIRVEYVGKQGGTQMFACKSYGTDAVFCYNFADPSINIKFDATGESSYYKRPYFLWDAYHDTSAKMSFYIDEVIVFQLSFEPTSVADGSPITFRNLLHVDATVVAVGPFSGL